MLEYVMKPIGVIHTPFHDTSNMPIQSARSEEHGKVEVFPEYMAGLEGIADFSHLYLLYAFHLANPRFQPQSSTFLRRSSSWALCHAVSGETQSDRFINRSHYRCTRKCDIL